MYMHLIFPHIHVDINTYVCTACVLSMCIHRVCLYLGICTRMNMEQPYKAHLRRRVASVRDELM